MRNANPEWIKTGPDGLHSGSPEALQAPRNPNEGAESVITDAARIAQMLERSPLLGKFRENDAWVITDSKLRETAGELGTTIPPLEAFAPTDLMTSRVDPRESKVLYHERAPFIPSTNPDLDVVLTDIIGESLASEFEVALCDGMFVTTGTGVKIPVTVFDFVPPEGIVVDEMCVGQARLRKAERANSELVRTVDDKVAQRDFAARLADTGIKQPRYIDVRELNSPDKTIACLNPDFSTLPISEILTTGMNTPHVWAILDSTQGFLIINDGSSRYLHSDNFGISQAIEALQLNHGNQLKLEEFSTRLESFITDLDKSTWCTIQLVAARDGRQDERISRDTTIPQILGHESTLYLKSTRTSGGQLVLCIKTNEAGEKRIVSDSPELGDILERSIDLIEEQEEFFRDSWGDSASPPPWVVPTDRILSLPGILGSIIARMESPIIEEEIPVPRVTTPLGLEKSEFRLIFQGDESPKLVAAYAKSSGKEVAANISYGGRGRAIDDVIGDIYDQYSNHQKSALSNVIAKSRCELLEKAQMFATKFAALHQKAGGFRDMRDFAVDICPVWNEQSQSIDFYLLEVQYRYGFSGLVEVSPEDAQKVQEYKDSLSQAEHSASDSGSRTFYNVDPSNLGSILVGAVLGPSIRPENPELEALLRTFLDRAK